MVDGELGKNKFVHIYILIFFTYVEVDRNDFIKKKSSERMQKKFEKAKKPKERGWLQQSFKISFFLSFARPFFFIIFFILMFNVDQGRNYMISKRFFLLRACRHQVISPLLSC